MATKKARPRLDDYVSKKQLAFLVTLVALVGSHYLAWPDSLTEKIVKLVLSYLGAQGGVDLVLALKGSKTR
ncbi:hypothetical protein MYX64_06430 [Nitrospinae bacterium AH_259_B05_G02_I21]|nr:hypothetical protein [Nitrospinae bacterium AH_259_B05_G02_I21]